jgi:hypothetical protein
MGASDAAPRFEMRVQITGGESDGSLVYACEGHRLFEGQFRVRVVAVPTEVVLRDGAATCPGRPAGVSIFSVSSLLSMASVSLMATREH